MNSCLELINSALTDHAYRWLTNGCVTVLQARTTNLSVDHFEYTCPMRYTEIDPHCG